MSRHRPTSDVNQFEALAVRLAEVLGYATALLLSIERNGGVVPSQHRGLVADFLDEQDAWIHEDELRGILDGASA